MNLYPWYDESHSVKVHIKAGMLFMISTKQVGVTAALPPVRIVIDVIVPELGMPDTFDGGFH